MDRRIYWFIVIFLAVAAVASWYAGSRLRPHTQPLVAENVSPLPDTVSWTWEDLSCSSDTSCQYRVCPENDLNHCYVCSGAPHVESGRMVVPPSSEDPRKTSNFVCQSFGDVCQDIGKRCAGTPPAGLEQYCQEQCAICGTCG